MGERHYNYRTCDVCGKNVKASEMLGKCIECGKFVCSSGLFGCGKVTMFMGKVYCKTCK